MDRGFLLLVFSVFSLLGLGGCLSAQPTEQYHTIRTLSPGNAEAAQLANERGLQFATEKDYVQAEEAFREALRNDVGYAAAHNNLGLVLLEKKKFYESALEFKFASKLNPKATEPILNLGRLYESIGWHEAAIKQYERAIELDPNIVEASGRLAKLYQNNQK